MNAGADLFNPQSWNAYGYVNNNPLNGVDPTGTDPFIPGDPGDPGLCWDDPFCGSWPIFPPAFGGGQPKPQIPAPPPMPVHFSNPTGVYAQGQGGDSFANKGPNGGGPTFNSSLSNPLWLYNLLNLLRLPYIDPSDPNHRLFGTHYCGAGGGGKTNSNVDRACKIHDDCFERARLSSLYNIGLQSNSEARRAAATACNQALYDAVTLYPQEAGSQAIQGWLLHGDLVGILAPGTTVTPH